MNTDPDKKERTLRPLRVLPSFRIVDKSTSTTFSVALLGVRCPLLFGCFLVSTMLLSRQLYFSEFSLGFPST